MVDSRIDRCASHALWYRAAVDAPGVSLQAQLADA